MLKPFHPDGEGNPYQQTVAQASSYFVATEPAISLLACQEDLETLAIEDAL